MKNLKLLSIALILLLAAAPSSRVKAATNQIQDTTRIGGTNRFETSVKIADYGWSHSSNVVLASAQLDASYADALTGTSLAYYLDCPILLTNINSTPDNVKDEITKLGVKNIYILGGTGVVSKSQETSLKSKGYNIIRIDGINRFETACKAADILNSKSKIQKVYIVTGYKFQYPLIAAPYAAREKSAILYTDGSSLNSITKNEILKLGIKDISIVGSYNIIPFSIEDQLCSLGVNCFRIQGTTPQSAASNFAILNGNTNQGISVVSEKTFPDALSASVLTAKNNYNLLPAGGEFNYEVNDNIKHALIFGQTGAVSSNIENYIKDIGNSKAISDDQIYQIFENSQVAIDDVTTSVSPENNPEKIEGQDGKTYLVLPQQYSSSEKIKDILSDYYTDGYLPTVMDYFSLITKIDGKAVIPEGDGGTLFDETTKEFKYRKNVDSNTVQVNYDEYCAEGGSFYDNVTVTLSLQDSKWKVSSIKYN
jgi:putative cell wall-binding protein